MAVQEVNWVAMGWAAWPTGSVADCWAWGVAVTRVGAVADWMVVGAAGQVAEVFDLDWLGVGWVVGFLAEGLSEQGLVGGLVGWLWGTWLSRTGWSGGWLVVQR